MKLLGKEYTFTFTMQAACLYERTTGRNPLNLKEEFADKLENLITLGYCILITSNQDEDIPTLEEMLKTIQVGDLTTLTVGTRAAIDQYFAPLPGEEAEDKAEDEDKKKNV